MAKITATQDDITITVEETDGKITVYLNGEQDDLMQAQLDDMAKESPPMGGTFYPEPGTMLSYYNLFTQGSLSGEKVTVTVEGDIGEIPNAPDCIY